MHDLMLLAQTAAVQLDGPESVLFGWDVVLTVALTTVLGSLWRQGKKNENLEKIVSTITPRYTGKIRKVVDYIDEVSDGWTDAEIAETAAFLSKKAGQIVAN